MSNSVVDCNLLFGLLALQNGLITRDQLVSAFSLWTCNKSRDLADVLVEQQALTVERKSQLRQMVDCHIQIHGQNPAQSLAVVSGVSSACQLLKEIEDPDLQVSLRQVPNAIGEFDPDATTRRDFGPSQVNEVRYQWLRAHAKGGLGQVSVALDSELHREVALKEILPNFADIPECRERFLLEAEITGCLEHPGIVPVYGLGRYEDGRPFYAMRFIDGDSLKDAIAHFHSPDNPDRRNAGNLQVALWQLLRRFIDVCNAMQYAHSRGVLHRDLKPGNIMLGKYGETLVVDWGLAKTAGRKETQFEGRILHPITTISSRGGTRSGTEIGTPAYMSPEQANGQVELHGPLSDVFGLGAILFELVTGKAPYDGKTSDEVLENARRRALRPIPDNYSASLKSLLDISLKAMHEEPGERFGSCSGLGAAIEKWLHYDPISNYLEDVKKLEQIVKERPDDLKTRVGLARSRVNLGIILHALERFNDAAERFQEAITDYDFLIVEDNASTSYREDAADSNLYLSRTLRAVGRIEEAQIVHIAALEHYNHLTTRFPDDKRYKEIHDEIHETLATFDSFKATPPNIPPSADRYQVQKELSAGGLGRVLLGLDTVLNRAVAIKTVPTPETAHVLHREATILGMLHHPNIVTVLDFVTLPNGEPALVMPLYNGKSLSQQLNRMLTPDERMKLLQPLLGISRALEAAHSQGVVHCDCNPSNILIGEFDDALLLDWGIATLMNETSDSETKQHPTIQGTMQGTPTYMAPEQAQGLHMKIGPRTDIYGFGGVLYVVLTSKPPNLAYGTSIREIMQFLMEPDVPVPSVTTLNPNVPKGLAAICEKALAKDPDKRFQSMTELRVTLEGVLGTGLNHEMSNGWLTQAKSWMGWK